MREESKPIIHSDSISKINTSIIVGQKIDFNIKSIY